jgi:hypothetical protein
MNDLLNQPGPIKAISLWQPWASLIAAGLKRHETRHWLTQYRGAIAIHASKTLDRAGAPDALCDAVFGLDWRDTLPRGAVIATAELTQVHHAATIVARLTRADLASGNFAAGRFAWRLDSVRALDEPIPLIGRQGLFNWTPPEDLAQRLGPEVDHAAACHGYRWAA